MGSTCHSSVDAHYHFTILILEAMKERASTSWASTVSGIKKKTFSREPSGNITWPFSLPRDISARDFSLMTCLFVS